MSKHYNHYKGFKHLHVPDNWEHYWSKYPNGFTILESLIDWVSQVNDMVDSSNENTEIIKCVERNFKALDKELRASWKGYKEHTEQTYTDFREEILTIVNQWIATIEPTIQDEVVSSLNQWLDDGTLADIINEDVFNMKANQSDLDDTNEQLAQTLKVIFPTGEDDSELVTNALNTYDRVMLVGGVFKLNIEINTSDKELFSRKAKIIPINDQLYPVIIKGDRNHIHDLDIETSGSRNGLHVDGNFNKIERVKVYALEKYILGSDLSYSPLVLVWGKYNLVGQSEAFNGGCGFTFQNGEYNILTHSHSHDNTMGVRNSGSSRYPKIINNTINNNDVSESTGADGLIIHRNVVGAIVKGNHISYSGEHGIYSQGDNAIIENNIVHNNARAGIKSGAHQTQLYEFEGVLYVSHHNIIKNNISHSNGSDGIFYQTPFEHITIEGNTTYNNGDEGIKTVAMSDTEDAVLGVLIIKNNDSESLWITGNENTIIEGNIVKNRIYTNSKGTAPELRMINPLIKNNVAGAVSLGRLYNGKIIGNTVKANFYVQESGKAYLENNDITSEVNIDCQNLDVWINNKVVFKNGCNFERFAGVRKAINNYFESLELTTGVYLLSASWGTGSRLLFSNNHLCVNEIGLFLETFVDNVMINGNLFEGSNSEETSIRLRGDNSVVVNNTSTNNAKANFHSNGIGKNNVLQFVNTPGDNHIISDNW